MSIQERTETALSTKNTVHDDSKARAPSDESLLDADEQDAAATMLKEWDDSWKAVSTYVEQWKVNRARSQGYSGVQLIKKQDRLQAYIPTNAKKGVSGLNKAARLCRRLRSAIFADPPAAEAIPAADDDKDRDAAETATRILTDICAEGNLAYTLHAGDAFDIGSDYGSGFLRFWVDEMGGGWKPKQIQASPQATDPEDPFPKGPDGEPLLVEPITRFVGEDGQFTEDRAKAAKQWLPKLRDEVLSGKQVRFLPYDVRDIWEAEGVQIGVAVTLGEFKRIFPEVQDWTDERITKLVSKRPQRFNDILEPHQKDSSTNPTSNRSLVFVLTRYHTQSARYPQGAYLIAAGEDELMHRSEWYDEEHGVPLDLPLTQFKQYTDEGNPYGNGAMSELGPGNEIRSAMVEAMLEHLRRFQNRLIFVPMTSTIQPQQFQAPTGTPIPILPGGEPKYEEIPDFPTIVEKMAAFISSELDDESGLQQAGQGLTSPSVKSAKHQEVVMQQVAAGLSDLRQNTERGLVRGWRIMLQQIRAYYTTPQQLAWVGDDGRYKQQAWTAADLGNTTDVRLQRGTFTQMTPQAKAIMAQQFAQMGMMSPFDVSHITESSLNPLFGLQDNPHRMRVRRQVALWQEGPPKDFVPQPAPPVAPPQDPVPGQPPQPPPNPFAPLLAQVFAPVPADTEPQIAALRTYELGRAMASTKFHKFPPAWQQGLVEAYGMARQSAQLPDAKMLQGLQQELAQAKQDAQQAQQKLGEAHVSFSGKLADLDEGQTMAVLAKDGIQVPPRQSPVAGTGQPDPQTQMAHERELHEMDLVADAHKTRIQEQAKTEREQMKQAMDAQRQERQHARDALLLRKAGGAKPNGAGGPITVQVHPSAEAAKHVDAVVGKAVGDSESRIQQGLEKLAAAIREPKEVEAVRDPKTGKLVGARTKPKKG